MMEDKELLDDFQDAAPMHWYSLNVLRNEDRCVSQIKEHIFMRKLHHKIADVKCLKEFSVVESEELDPHSDQLPKTGFKFTPTSIWVTTATGNYKKLKLVQRNPFSGTIFIKMVFDMDLFKMIRSWGVGYLFLGGTKPEPISDDQLNKTIASLNCESIDLLEYASSKGYKLANKDVPAEKLILDLQDQNHSGKFSKRQEIDDSRILDEDEFNVAKLTPEEEKEKQKAKIYSDLNIDDHARSFSQETVGATKSSKQKQEFNVNDFVLITHLGFKGTIQEIDYSADRVVVGVHMFGRRQPVECKIKDIKIV